MKYVQTFAKMKRIQIRDIYNKHTSTIFTLINVNIITCFFKYFFHVEISNISKTKQTLNVARQH